MEKRSETETMCVLSTCHKVFSQKLRNLDAKAQKLVMSSSIQRDIVLSLCNDKYMCARVCVCVRTELVFTQQSGFDAINWIQIQNFGVINGGIVCQLQNRGGKCVAS